MNERDLEGNLHGAYLEKNPDGSIKKQGQYIHGVFYTGNSHKKKQDPVRYPILRALNSLEHLSIETKEQKAHLKKAKEALSLLYRSLQKTK